MTLKVKARADQVFEAIGLVDPTDTDLNNLGLFLRQQVDDRFRTQGTSGGVQWPEKMIKDGRATLTGQRAELRESFRHYIHREGNNKAKVVVFSDVKYSHVHQLGTEKYGGPIPTIRPKSAKALFIPLSDRARGTDRYEGSEAAVLRKAGGMEPLEKPIRVATRGARVSTRDYLRRTGGGGVSELAGGAKLREMGFGLDNRPFKSLKKGRFNNGQLEVWNERSKKWEAGQPDFMFLQKVDIPPRPMLPDGQEEQKAQREFVASITGGETP